LCTWPVKRGDSRCEPERRIVKGLSAMAPSYFGEAAGFTLPVPPRPGEERYRPTLYARGWTATDVIGWSRAGSEFSHPTGCELAAIRVSPVEWIREGEILPPPVSGDPDSLRAMRPWVLEEADGTLRMWYSGHDGTRHLCGIRAARRWSSFR
jgi:hypothetical protein